MRADGSGEQIISDVHLRNQFPPPGKVKATRAGTTPTEILKVRLADLSEALDKLDSAFIRVGEVNGNDANSLVETVGVDPSFCETRREALRKIGDELSFWERTYRKRHGAAAPAVSVKIDEDIDDEFDDADESEPVSNTATDYRFIYRMNFAAKDSPSRKTRGYHVNIRIVGVKTMTKLFSDQKMGGRKEALKAALRFRNAFCKKHSITI